MRGAPLLVLGALVLAGCTSPGTADPPKDRALALQRVEGCMGQQATELSVVVSDQAAWADLWARACGGGERPAVDFARQSVVAYFWGEKNTGGFGVLVRNVTEKADHVRIDVERGRPAPTCGVTQAITYPADLVLTERVTKASRFQFRDSEIPC